MPPPPLPKKAIRRGAPVFPMGTGPARRNREARRRRRRQRRADWHQPRHADHARQWAHVGLRGQKIRQALLQSRRHKRRLAELDAGPVAISDQRSRTLGVRRMGRLLEEALSHAHEVGLQKGGLDLVTPNRANDAANLNLAQARGKAADCSASPQDQQTPAAVSSTTFTNT
jgi:hypothetical protein